MSNMKKYIVLGGFFIAFALTSCNKDIHKMEIVKDCSTIYLRDKSGQDYKVCNDELLESYAAGTKIKVSYDNLEQCFGLIENETCESTHLISGVIEVTEIH